MNTKIILFASSIILGMGGILLIFMPDFILAYFDIQENFTSALFMQILGSMYFALSLLNWMSKGNLIGGIYNRPIAFTNFTHFFITSIFLVRGLIASPGYNYIFWTMTIVYLIFSILFTLILFTHPKKVTDNK